MERGCNCIKDIDAKLAPEHCLNSTLLDNPTRPIISLVRLDKWIIETRRGKPTAFLPSFCPFCGVKYPEAATS